MFTAILPQLHYGQPMNPLHPLNMNGLRVWWKALPNISGAKIILDLASNRYPATLVNHTWGGVGPFGPQTLVPVYNSTALSIANTNFNQNASVRTYTFWFRRTGAGGSSDGYMISKRTTPNAEIESIDLTSVTGRLNYNQKWSTHVGGWWIDSPPLNEWHFGAVSYDYGSTANDPVMYLDGISKTVTEANTPTGTLTTNTDNFSLGGQNAGGGVGQVFDGQMDDVRIYDRILTPGQVYQLFQDSKNPYSSLYNWRPCVVFFASSMSFLLWRRVMRLVRRS